MDEIYEIVDQVKYSFFGIDEVYKLVMDVQNRLIYCEIWVRILQNLRCLSCKSINFVLRVKPTSISLVWLFGLCLFVWYVWFIKLCCVRCRCGKKENILNFALSPLRLVQMKFLMSSIFKLVCKRCIGWKQLVKIFLSSVKMICLRCFCCAMKFNMPSVVKLGCKRYIGWKG